MLETNNHRIAGLDLQLCCYSRIASNPYIINVSRVGLNTINVHEYRTYTAVCITSPGDFNVTLPTKNAMYLLGLQNM